MKRGLEQEAVVRQILSEIFDPTGDLPNHFDVSGLLGSLASRQQAAASINERLRRFFVERDGRRFAGVVTDMELQAVGTGAELKSLVLRHLNGEVEDDAWSAF